MSQEWYYSVDGDRQGPITSGELKKLADAGKVGPADLVWKEGMADWVAAKSIKGLFGGAAAATGGIGAVAQAGAAKAAKNVDDDVDDDGRPAVRSKQRNTDDDERPSRRSRPADDEEDERPSSRARRNRSDDEEDEDRPVRRRGRDEEEDERPSRRSKGGRRRVPEDTGSKKMTAGLLGIFLGGWGVHKFYLGMSTPGIIQIVVSICTCGLGGVIGLIEGIIYLTKSDEDFHQTYVVEEKQWF